MYGLIHRSMRDFIREQGGQGAWDRVQKDLGADPSWFRTMESYDDEVTLSILDAGASILGVSPGVFLRGLGRYWSTKTAPENYGSLMSLGGKGVRPFVRNLDAMHDQVALSFLNLAQPSFSVVDEDERTMIVSYESSREGLEDFVIGLLEGLGAYFGEKLEVGLLRTREEGGVRFAIRWPQEQAS